MVNSPFLLNHSFNGLLSQISLLRDLCEEHLLQTMSVTNVISLFHVAVSYQLGCLEWQCADHIRQNLPEVAQHSEMRDLTAEEMNSFLGSQHVSKLDPEMKLFLLISWLTEDVSNRQQYLVMLLGHIDWLTVAQDFLMDISQTDNFFTSNPSSLYLLLQTLHSASIGLGPYADQFEQLRDEYSYLLNSVVSCSVHIGMGKHSQFQPISLSLVSGPGEDIDEKNPQHDNKLQYEKTSCSISKNEDLKNSDSLVPEENRVNQLQLKSKPKTKLRKPVKAGEGNSRDLRKKSNRCLKNKQNSSDNNGNESIALEDTINARKKTLKRKAEDVLDPNSSILSSVHKRFAAEKCTKGLHYTTIKSKVSKTHTSLKVFDDSESFVERKSNPSSSTESLKQSHAVKNSSSGRGKGKSTKVKKKQIDNTGEFCFCFFP